MVLYLSESRLTRTRGATSLERDCTKTDSRAQAHKEEGCRRPRRSADVSEAVTKVPHDQPIDLTPGAIGTRRELVERALLVQEMG